MSMASDSVIFSRSRTLTSVFFFCTFFFGTFFFTTLARTAVVAPKHLALLAPYFTVIDTVYV